MKPVFFISLLLALTFGAKADPELRYDPGTEIKLNGPWEFYWKKLKTDIAASKPDTLIFNPGSWVDMGYPSFGFATYKITIYTQNPDATSALQLRGFYSAYRLYLNDKLIGSNGIVGKSKDSSSLQWIPQVIPIHLKQGSNELIVEVSNFQHSKGGFFRPIVLGDYKELSYRYEKSKIIEALTAGAFFMIGIFFLGLFVFWRSSIQFIVYNVLTIGYGVRTLSIDSHLLKYIFADWPWQILVGIEYFTFYLVWLMSLILIVEAIPKKAFRIISAYFIVLLISVIVLPLHVYSKILMPAVLTGYSIYVWVLIMLILRRKKVTKANFWFILTYLVLALITFAIEFLVYHDWLSMDYLPSLMRLLSVLVLAFLVSEQYSSAYKEVEKLRVQAERQKQIIENQIDELKIRNEKIELLIREVHHRVKNNLQLVASLLDVKRPGLSIQDADKLLKDSQSRVASMSLIHENLYLNDEIQSMHLGAYLDDLIIQLLEIQGMEPNQNITIEVADLQFSPDVIVPLGLILTELVTNAFKHAKKDQSTFKLIIRIAQCDQNTYELEVIDNGPNLKKSLEELIQTSFGLRLASRLAFQLNGKITHSYKEGNNFKVKFQADDLHK